MPSELLSRSSRRVNRFLRQRSKRKGATRLGVAVSRRSPGHGGVASSSACAAATGALAGGPGPDWRVSSPLRTPSALRKCAFAAVAPTSQPEGHPRLLPSIRRVAGAATPGGRAAVSAASAAYRGEAGAKRRRCGAGGVPDTHQTGRNLGVLDKFPGVPLEMLLIC